MFKKLVSEMQSDAKVTDTINITIIISSIVSLCTNSTKYRYLPSVRSYSSMPEKVDLAELRRKQEEQEHRRARVDTTAINRLLQSSTRTAQQREEDQLFRARGKQLQLEQEDCSSTKDKVTKPQNQVAPADEQPESSS